MDYASLTRSIGGAMNRGDLYQNIPDFIALIEGEIGRDLRHWRMIARSEATLSAEFYPLPPDFLEMISVKLDGTDEVLDNLSPDGIAERKATSSPTAGKPDSYALIGGLIQPFPVPDQGYATIITYYQAIPALSGSNTSNWLLAGFPDVYLYGALSHAGAFLEGDKRLPVWRGLYGSALASAQNEGVKALAGARLTPRAQNIV